MRIGVTLPMSFSDGPGRMPAWADVHAMAEAAEAAGLDSVWICDHLLSVPPGRPPEGVLEAWTILSALAATTTRVTIGTLVTCATFRHPALLAAMATTADGISGGRVVLGLGAGVPGLEHTAYGFPADDRVTRFAETLEIVAGLLRGDTVSTSGRHFQLDNASVQPAPSRQVPIMVAANGPRMMRLTARHAQSWITAWHGRPDDHLRARLAAMAEALAAEGRDPATLPVTVGLSGDIPPAELSGTIGDYAALGVAELIVAVTPRTPESIHGLARALAR